MQDDDFDNETVDGDMSGIERAQRPNKEQLKRETLALKGLVTQLLELPPAQLDTVSLDADIREQLIKAGKMERGALKRQIKFIVGLLRGSDTGILERQLQQLARTHRRQVQEFHETEQWRDELLDGNDELIDTLVTRFVADRQRLRQLVRNARRERESAGPQKSARLLFRYLSELRERD